MANSGLSALIPDVYVALNVVSRELVGMIPAVSRDGRLERAAVGENIRIHQAPAAAATDITPGVTPPNDGDQTIGNMTMQITKSRRVPFRWNGEEEKGVNQGHGVLSLQQDQVAQAIRTLVNEAEADLTGLQVGMSRAYGTPGTTPFNTAGDWTDASETLRILKDNGTPISDLQMVINTGAGARFLGKQAQAQMSNDTTILKQGVLIDIHGFQIRESAQVQQFTKGTGASYTTTAAGFAVGTTSIPLITGTGTVKAGEVITFAGDTNQYVVATGIAAPGTIVLAAPGLRVAIPAAATAVTILNSSARNMAFRRSAIQLAHRLPALPKGGDLATDRTTIQDERSGLVFEIAMYPQYRQMQYEISAAWGVGLIKPEHAALLLG